MRVDNFLKMHADVFVYIIILFAYIIFIPSFGDCIIRILDENTGIFFGVISTPNSRHQKFMYNAWIRDLPLYSPESGVAFVTNVGKEIPGVLYLHPGEKFEYLKKLPGSLPIDRDIVIKRYVGAKYFLENTTYKWFWSLSDDALILPENIPHIIDDLNSRYNTYKDSHLEGHCIDAWCHVYMQGGSGYIFSRKAAEKFVEIAIPFIENMTWLDDIEFEKMRDYLGVSITQSASKFIYGHNFVNDINENFYNILDYCPDSIPRTKCYGDKLFSIKHLTEYHSLKHKKIHMLPTMKKHFKTVQKQGLLHPDISYYYSDLSLYFCKRKANHKVI